MGSSAMSKHTLSVLVENRPGVLARVAMLFSRRGFNIDSLAVGPTERDDRSRVTLRVDCSQTSVDQVVKQLYKLVNVLKVSEFDPPDTVERELVLFKVHVAVDRRAELLRLVEPLGARVADLGPTAVVLEAVEHPDRLAALEELLRPYGIREVVRGGRVAMGRVSAERGRRPRLQVLA
jgi:acetolactate synthase I/III small subunit